MRLLIATQRWVRWLLRTVDPDEGRASLGRTLTARASLGLLALLGSSIPWGASSAEPGRTVPTAYRVERHFAAGLEYLTVEPPDLPVGAELPMVVYLHGRGGAPTPPAEGPYLGLRVPVRLVIPRAPDPYGDGYAWMPVSAHAGETEALNRAIEDRGRRLADALVAWQRRHPTRGAPLVVGFSQGAILAVHLATAHPEAVSAVFPMAGWLPPGLMPPGSDPYAVHPAIHALHGGVDPVLGVERSRRTFRALRRLGYEVTFEVFPDTGHAIGPGMEDRMRQLLDEALRAMPGDRAHAGEA
ncbi:MAG: alpha/beta hydrolase [Sandaracinaceae bacterium]